MGVEMVESGPEGAEVVGRGVTNVMLVFDGA